MKPFNLEEYLKNPWRKIVTRDGRNVRIICTNKKGTKLPIVALVECENIEKTCCYTTKGYWNSGEIESNIDLFFAPEKKEGWINIYKAVGDRASDYHIWSTEEDAKKEENIRSNYVATIKIEWEE